MLLLATYEGTLAAERGVMAEVRCMYNSLLSCVYKLPPALPLDPSSDRGEAKHAGQFGRGDTVTLERDTPQSALVVKRVDTSLSVEVYT